MGKGPAALWGPPLVPAPLPRHSHIQVVLQGLGRDTGLVVLGGQVVGVLLQVAFQQAMLLQDLPQGLPPPQRDPGVQGRGEPIRHQELGRDMPRGGLRVPPPCACPVPHPTAPGVGPGVRPRCGEPQPWRWLAGGAGTRLSLHPWELGSHPACLPTSMGTGGPRDRGGRVGTPTSQYSPGAKALGQGH